MPWEKKINIMNKETDESKVTTVTSSAMKPFAVITLELDEL